MNLQVHLTPEGREEAIKAVETNTGRKPILSKRSPGYRGMVPDLFFFKIHSRLGSSRRLNKGVQRLSLQRWILAFCPGATWKIAV